MPPDAALSWRRDALVEAIPAGWRKPLARIALAWLALALVAAADWATMAGKWWSVSTYNHVLFVPLIVGWLAWVRRRQVGALVPRAWWPGLAALAGALFLWLLGRLAGVNSASQLGAVLALQAAVPALLGPRVAAALLFPLAYMLFLVPFGDELVPALQMITADIVIWLTRVSGVPAHIEGVFIDTPVGLFEVAEACSGVQFLVAMLALGVLIAQTCFRGWGRRVAFLAFALALPILANGVRAWGTIYIAQFQGSNLPRASITSSTAGYSSRWSSPSCWALPGAGSTAIRRTRASMSKGWSVRACSTGWAARQCRPARRWPPSSRLPAVSRSGPGLPRASRPRCPHASPYPRCRDGSGSTMPRRCHGCRARPARRTG